MDDAMIGRRLEELRGELSRGEASLEELDRRRGAIRAQLLRISGAVQVLEEMLAAAGVGTVDGAVAAR
jgi:hypothetical protein